MSENNDNSRSDRTCDSSRNAEDYRSRRRGSRDSPSTTRARDVHDEDRTLETSNEPFTRPEWENLPSDPDMRTDLGYEITAWETIETATDSSQIIYMPQDEELLRDDTFIVAEEDILCDLGKQY